MAPSRPSFFMYSKVRSGLLGSKMVRIPGSGPGIAGFSAARPATIREAGLRQDPLLELDRGQRLVKVRDQVLRVLQARPKSEASPA